MEEKQPLEKEEKKDSSPNNNPKKENESDDSEEENEKEEEINVNPKVDQKNPPSSKSTPPLDKKEEEDDEDKPCPEKSRFHHDPYLGSNPLSRFFFYWAFYALKIAGKYKLKPIDLGKPSGSNDCSRFSKHLESIWEGKGYKHCKRFALFKTILRANACPLITVIFLSLLVAGLDYYSVIVTKQFIDYFDKTEKEGESVFVLDFDLWVLGTMFLGSQIFSAFLNLHTQMKQNNFGNKAGFELNCFIYDKILKYAPSGFNQRASHGEIINFVQIDSDRLSMLVSSAPNLFVGPIMILAYIYLLFDFFGFVFISGVAFLLLFLVFHYYISMVFRLKVKTMMGKKDYCMKITTESFDNIKILKLYNWEHEFRRKMLDARRIEMDYQNGAFNLVILNETMHWLCPSLICISTIGLYQKFHDKFNISTMLIGLSIFSKIQIPIRNLPLIITSAMETYVSIKRIEKFIKQPDINENLVHRGKYDPKGEFAIKIEGGTFSWGVKQQKGPSRFDVLTKKEKEKLKEEEIKQMQQEQAMKLEGESSSSDEEENENNIENNIDNNIDNNNNNIDNENININTDSDKKDNNNDLKENLIPDSQRSTLLVKGDQQQKEKEKPKKISSNSNSSKKIKEFTKDGCKIQIPVPKNIDYDITLKNINLLVKPGELVGIVGEVGCGKSSLLQAMLNSLILLNPRDCDGIHINGSVGYASQIPWIQNDTIKNNILFSKPYDAEKYQQVIKLCQLKEDLETFDGGDMTEIGEKGVNLSGGQKVRISLARMIYNEPDIYLFDDPISALDANVGKKIMKYCIVKHLKSKTRIVVTHALSYLKYMDRIIYMNNGRIDWVGTFKEVRDQPFYSQLGKTLGFSRLGNPDMSESQSQLEENNKGGQNNEINNKNDKVVKIVEEEEQSRKSIKCSVYMDYFRYMGGLFFMSLAVTVVFFGQLNKGGSDLWLAYWSEDKNQKKTEKDPMKKWIFFIVFSAMGLISVFFMFLRILMTRAGAIILGRRVHKEMIEKLVKAPINLFHETIPRGQIYNRLSRDLNNLLRANWSLDDLLVSLLSVISSFVLCGIYDTYSLLYMPIVFIIGYFVTRFYLKGSRPLNRVASISRSPILNIISETLPGNTSIRTFEVKNFYIDKFYNRINNSLNMNLIVRGISIWFQEMFKLLSIFYLLYLVLRTIFNEENVTAQSCAIVFTYSVLLQEYLGNTFNRCAELENSMVSMERCVKYTHIKQELPSYVPEIDDRLMGERWPQNGGVKFQNYSVRYRPNTEVVLKNLSIEIAPGEKVGVCGRTGSGKSTLCLCLFRILEPLEGTIYIDGVDIKKIGLDLLRQNITIIPQDPCLFEGTLKYNIDPFNQRDNQEVIQIIKDIGFEYTESDDKIMDKMIEQNGANLSVGQKQLVCIARAFLRRTKIIVMDEATANIDMKTEQVIQRALNIVLQNSTVITVAHRIKTIIGYDKILVLDSGEVKEFDTPENLIKDKNSLFHELYSKSTL